MVDPQESTRLTLRRRRRAANRPTTREPCALQSPYPIESVRTPESLNLLTPRQNESTHIGQQIAQIVLNSSDPETILPGLISILTEAFQVDYCLIAAIASHSATVQTACWYPTPLQSNQTQLLNLQMEHLVKSVIESTTDPLAVAHLQAIEIEPSGFSDRSDSSVKAVLGMTTRFQGHVNGVVAMMRSRIHDWTVSEKEGFKALSNAIAMAISQVQLQRKVHTSVEYQSLLNRLTMAIRSSTELDRILKLALDGTAQTLQVDQGLVLLLKYTDPLFKSCIHQRLPRAKVTVVGEWSSALAPESPQNAGTFLNQSFWLSDSQLCQQAFWNSPKPLVMTNRAHSVNDPSLNGTSISALDTMPALLLVPLESQGNVLGFFALQQRQPRSWQSEELELAELVSAQLSTAILQFQTMRQAAALVEERTAQLQSSLAVQAKLYEKTRQQVEQLRQFNQLKDEFIANVSHELKTPLTKMKMAIQNLRRPALSPDKQAQYLDILEQQCSQEIELIEDLLALQKLESHQVPRQVQRVDLKRLIEELAQTFAQDWADKGLTLATQFPERSLMLQSDLESLSRILQELLTNAGKYSDPETTIHLRATSLGEQPSPQIVVTLSNTGAGISPTEQLYIFDKFRRGQGVTKQAIQGTGLGLALVKSLVEHLNGTIVVASSPISDSLSWETCFTLTLPQFVDSTKI